MSISPSRHKAEGKGVEPSSRRAGTALAEQPGQPYPATFRTLVDPPGIEPGSPVCQTGVVPLDHEPFAFKWTAGESNPDFLLARQVSSRWTRSPCCCFQRSVRELNPAFLPTEQTCCRNTYRPNHRVTPDRVELPLPARHPDVFAVGPRDR